MAALRTTTTIVCAAVCLGTAWLWHRSRTTSDVLAVATPGGGHLQAVASHRGGVVLFVSEVPAEIESGRAADHVAAAADEFDFADDAVFDPTAVSRSGLGFKLASGSLTMGGLTPAYRAVRVPHVAVVMMSGVVSLLLLRAPIRRRRWAKQGRCRACGYDLRESPERCPECGRPTAGNAQETKPGRERTALSARRGAVVAGGAALFMVALGFGARRAMISLAPDRALDQEVFHVHDVAALAEGEALWRADAADPHAASADARPRASSPLWRCFGPAPGDDEPPDRTALMASLADIVPVAETAYVPIEVRSWPGRVAMVGPVAAQRQFAQLLQALSAPATGGILTVVAGDQAPTTRGTQNVDAKLALVLPEVRLDNGTLEAAIDQLRDATRANIVVDWAALERAGIDRATPVRLHVWDLPLSRALDVVLAMAGSGVATLGFRAEDGIIRVTTHEDLEASGATMRIYDVRPLILRYAASNEELDDFITGGRPATAPAEDSGEQREPTREEIIEQLTTMLRELVDPDSWRENGGSLGSMREWAGRLIITQSPENHRRTEEFLKKLNDNSAPGGPGIPPRPDRPATSPAAPPSPRRPAGGQGLFGHG